MDRKVLKYGKQEKKEETLTNKMKRSLDKRYTETHGSLTKVLQ